MPVLTVAVKAMRVCYSLRMRIIGLDYGSRRVGVALGDTETRLSSPWDVWEGLDNDALVHQVKEALALENADMVVVGVPRLLGDRVRETNQAKIIRRFIASLREAGVQVTEEDETLSTVLASTQVAERGERGKRDDLAATAILQTYLDRVDSMNQEPSSG